MRFLYSLGLSIYALLLRLVAPFNPKAAAWVAGREGLLPRIEQALAGDAAPRLWIHCASLGEFEQGRPLIEGLRGQYPGHKIVLTFFSPSGYEVRKSWAGADYVFYLPLDTADNARRFVAAVQPRLAVFVKYEFWYYFLRELRTHGIPAVVVAAIFRPSQVFFKPWGGFFRDILGQLHHIFTQNEASAELLRGLGLTRVSVAGDTRFDTVAATALAPARPLPLAEAFVADGAPVLVAGSTWPEDLPALAPLLRKHARAMRFIIAPHEVSEAHLQEVEAALPGLTVRYSRATPATVADARLLLIDNAAAPATTARASLRRSSTSRRPTPRIRCSPPPPTTAAFCKPCCPGAASSPPPPACSPRPPTPPTAAAGPPARPTPPLPGPAAWGWPPPAGARPSGNGAATTTSRASL